MNGQIFISYRREDASSAAGRLYDRLKSRFAAEKIFMDVDSLAPGVDFVEALERSVGGCDVLIAVIGRRWLSASDEEGNRRLDNPEDFVRVEVATALRRGIRVIPVLVEGASVPRSRELPDDLKALVRRNALEVSHNRFSADSERLIRAVEEVLESARVEQQRKREGKERLEAERRQKEAQERLEAERRQREAQERLQAEQREKERLEAQCREREEKERLEAERRQQAERERLEAQQREKERREQERLRAEQDRLEAERERYEKAAAEGDAEAMNSLGVLYQGGRGVAQDYAQARAWYQKAAEAGNASGMVNLGHLYQTGQGGARDYAQARWWYQKAAEAGDVWAQEWLQAEEGEKERLEALRRKREEKERLEVERPQLEAQERLDAAGRQKETPAPEGKGAGLRARVLAVLEKRPRRLVIIGSGVAILLLSFGLLFKAPPLPTPTTTPSNAPSPTPSVSQASPSPSPSGAELLSQAQRYLDTEDFAKALPLLQKAADASKTAFAAGNKYTIALIPGLTTDRFYIMMHKGAEAAAKALGVDLIFQGAPDFNPVTQVPVLNAVTARHPSAILIAPTGRVQLIAPLRKAFEAGIPVVTVDTFIGNGHYQTGTGDADFPLCYVASDNILGGEIAARALAKAIGDKGKVYVSNVKPGISVTDQREQGFKQEMKKHPNITVLETQFNDDDANKAASQFQSVLARNPDLAGVFGANLFSAMGVSNGAKQAGATGKVKVVAFDAPASLMPEIKAGTVDIAIAQHPAEMGYFGVVAAYAHLGGQSIPPLIGTGFTVIDKANVDDPNVKRFMY